MAAAICYRRYIKDGVELIWAKHSSLSYPLHNHVSVYIIGAILSGSLSVKNREGENLSGPDQTFLIRPYEPHSLFAEGTYSLLCFCISKNLVENTSQNNIMATFQNFLQRQQPDWICNGDLSCKIAHMVSHLCICSNWRTISPSAAMERIRVKLEENPEESYPITKMARETFTSKYQLIRQFRQEVGLTPRHFQIQNRIRRAQRLLEETYAITEIALASGFYDQSHFIRQFKAVVRLTPSCYRKVCQLVW